jgi:hypothetical protein
MSLRWLHSWYLGLGADQKDCRMRLVTSVLSFLGRSINPAIYLVCAQYQLSTQNQIRFNIQKNRYNLHLSKVKVLKKGLWVFKENTQP